jgi:hypothetical protein
VIEGTATLFDVKADSPNSRFRNSSVIVSFTRVCRHFVIDRQQVQTMSASNSDHRIPHSSLDSTRPHRGLLSFLLSSIADTWIRCSDEAWKNLSAAGKSGYLNSRESRPLQPCYLQSHSTFTFQFISDTAFTVLKKPVRDYGYAIRCLCATG